MELINCNNLNVIPTRTYGGLTGSKIAVIYNNDIYMLKSQQNLKQRAMRNVELSYAFDPITEWLGSHIYELLSVPVHKTLLGTYNNKICVLCKDLVYPGRITEFKELRNLIFDEDVFMDHSGMSNNLEDIFIVFKLLSNILPDDTQKRFDQMLVVDGLIGNTDRNNGNWGFIDTAGKLLLVPVYDNGGAFNNKRSDNQMLNDLNTGNVKDLALNFTTNFILKGKRVNPLHTVAKVKSDYMLEILNRISNLSINQIIFLLDELIDCNLISDIRYKFYLSLLTYRIDYYKSILGD